MSRLTPKQIPAAYQKALGLQNKGRLNEALQLYQQIAAANPRIPEVHFQVGRIFASAGRHAKALPHLREAAKLKPKEPAIWHAWGEAVTGLGEPAKTEAYAKALARAPIPAAARRKITAMIGLGDAGPTDLSGGAEAGALAELETQLERGEAEAALKGAKRLLAAHPKSAAAMLVQARAQAAQGHATAATKSFRDAIALAPGAAPLHEALGRFLLDHALLVQAIEELRRAIALDPESATARAALARALTRLDQYDEAQTLLGQAIALAPDLAEAHANLGTLQVAQGDDEAAITAYERAVELGDTSPQTLTFLARSQGVMRREDEALANFARAIEADPTYAFAYARRASLLQNRGAFDAAEADFRKALELDPGNGETYRVFSASHKFTQGDPLIAQMQARFDDPALSDTDKRNLGFALSKALEDTKQYDQVFRYLHPANALMRKAYPYDIQTRVEEIARLKEAFAGMDYDAIDTSGFSDFAPIFVTGMPRSGTTLVEQILASHSTVTGAGEIGEFSRKSYELIATPSGPFTPLGQIAPKALEDLGRGFEAYMRRLFPGSDRITDKSIQTYAFIGLVRLALPRARIVVVRRDPRDNLLSIYKNTFNEGTHRYAYSLSDLGQYYKLFEDIVGFWRDTLPGSFHEIHYDALTSEPEAEARKLLAACDLEWEDACLNFHQNTRRVDTLSVYQVRQPIYRSSVKAWERYENELGELFDALR